MSIDINEITKIKNRIREQISDTRNNYSDEQKTKQYLIAPFLGALGYDISEPTEVIPEYTADFGTKSGEKVDYAIMAGDKPVIIVECKKFGTQLGANVTGQLFRYFSVAGAEIGIVTDGRNYKFFSDTERTNVMDKEPYLVFDLLATPEHELVELMRQYTKDYLHEVKQNLIEQYHQTRAEERRIKLEQERWEQDEFERKINLKQHKLYFTDEQMRVHWRNQATAEAQGTWIAIGIVGGVIVGAIILVMIIAAAAS